jgi:hypothetical protein
LKNDIPEKWKYDHWKPHHTAAVKELKEALCTYPVLRLPDVTASVSQYAIYAAVASDGRAGAA